MRMDISEFTAAFDDAVRDLSARTGISVEDLTAALWAMSYARDDTIYGPFRPENTDMANPHHSDR